jgi:hypothetical protein
MPQSLKIDTGAGYVIAGVARLLDVTHDGDALNWTFFVDAQGSPLGRRRWTIVTDVSRPVVIRDHYRTTMDDEHDEPVRDDYLAAALSVLIDEELVRAQLAQLVTHEVAA